MRFLALLGVLAMQCAATKTWSGDNYSEETFSVLGWIGYLKRLSVIVLMLSGVILYYVPESRPHARRACYIMIDFAANGLKSALCSDESEYMYENIKSKYHRARYEQSLSTQKKHLSGEVHENNQTKPLADDDGSSREQDRKKSSLKKMKEEKRGHHRQSRHRLRGAIIKNTSEPCMEVVQPKYFYSEKFEELQKYLKPRICGVKRFDGGTMENYAFLISGSPREMAMIDQKFEKDDVVILQDPYLKVEYKECGTGTDKISMKPGDLSNSEQEGPTRDRNDYGTDSGMEAYTYKEVDSSSVPEVNSARCSEYEAVYRRNQYQCGGECCGDECSQSCADIYDNDEAANLVPPIAKLPQNFVNARTYKKKEDTSDNLYMDATNNYGPAENRVLTKPQRSFNERKVNFRQEVQKPRVQTKVAQKQSDARPHENISRTVRKLKSKNEDALKGFCCNVNPYFTDRGGEADDENSQHGRRVTTKHDLDEKPQRESRLLFKNSNDSVLLDYDYDYGEFHSNPMAMNRVKPALLRAVNWIFGGCPEAARRAESKRAEVGKEEIQEVADEWLR